MNIDKNDINIKELQKGIIFWKNFKFQVFLKSR